MVTTERHDEKSRPPVSLLCAARLVCKPANTRFDNQSQYDSRKNKSPTTEASKRLEELRAGDKNPFFVPLLQMLRTAA